MADAERTNAEWSDLAERTEAVAMQRMMQDQSPATRELLGVAVHPVADGVHTVVARDPMGGYWNKALGFREVVTRDVVAQVVDETRAAGAPAFALQVQPRAVPDDWDVIAEEHGLTRGTTFVKCFGPAQPQRVETDLRIARLTADDAEAYVAVMAEGFGFPVTPEATALFGGPQFYGGDWAAYGAFDGEDLLGVALMLAVPETDAVAMFGASTLARGRNRGAQGALFAARMAEARDRGLRYASAETWLEAADNPNPSQHNMRRAGLVEVHTRPNWVWRAT